MDMERELAVREYKTYAYVIFDLQQYFYESFARSNPQMLSQRKVDEHFIEQICRLNTDRFFWAGMPSGDGLNEYLVRYVLMYFDYDYAPGSFMDEYLRQFINSRRDYRPPSKNSTVYIERGQRDILSIQRRVEKNEPQGTCSAIPAKGPEAASG